MKQITKKRLLIPLIGIILLSMAYPTIGFENDFVDSPMFSFFDDVYDGFTNIWDLDEVDGASSDSSQGSFQINAGPGDVTGVDFQTDVYVTDDALDPDASTYQRLNFTASMPSGFIDVDNITIWIFDDSTHATTYNSSAPDGLLLVEFTWINSTDVWSVADQGSCTEWTVDTSGSDDPGTGSSDTTFELSMRFRIGRAARADTTDWNASIHVFDGDTPAEVGLGSETTLVTMNENFDTSLSISTFTWGTTVQPSSDNNTHQAMTLTIYANTQWEITLSASNFTASAQSDVDPEVNNILLWDQDGSGGGTSKLIRNTTAPMLGTWDDQGAMSDDSGMGRDCHFWLNPLTVFAAGVTWYVTVTATTQSNT